MSGGTYQPLRPCRKESRHPQSTFPTRFQVPYGEYQYSLLRPSRLCPDARGGHGRVRQELAKAIGNDQDRAGADHGLRKAAGVKLAESGASVQMIMSVLGHRSPRMALYYCEQANKRELSDEAMKLWERAA
jgi:integrase